LVGLLYLENNLATGTFTPRRIAVLELLGFAGGDLDRDARLYAER